MVSIILHQVFFQHGDVMDARTLNPFTHVYMFDIGFPPALFRALSAMFNRSHSKWLICYHGPKLIKEKYGFHVELLVQKPTSMHGRHVNLPFPSPSCHFIVKSPPSFYPLVVQNRLIGGSHSLLLPACVQQ